MSKNDFERNERFRKGEALRREVLGSAHVDRSLGAATDDPFLMPIQQLTVEFRWGTIWSRPGLPRKTRSFICIAFLAALGKHDELRTHLIGALNNGATWEEITEVLLQAALYCGFPVGLECFRIAKEVLDGHGVEA